MHCVDFAIMRGGEGEIARWYACLKK